MADDGYIAIVYGETQDWAHWDKKEDALAAAEQHLRERLWDHYKHVKTINNEALERIIKESDFRLYRIGEECYRVAMPWEEWIRAWWEYKTLSQEIDSVREQLKEALDLVLRHMSEWEYMNREQAGEGGFSMGSPSTEALLAYRTYKELRSKLTKLEEKEKTY